jgi:hypothetical protein
VYKLLIVEKAATGLISTDADVNVNVLTAYKSASVGTGTVKSL